MDEATLNKGAKGEKINLRIGLVINNLELLYALLLLQVIQKKLSYLYNLNSNMYCLNKQCMNIVCDNI